MSGTRLVRLSLNTFDAAALAGFFVDALGFARVGDSVVQLGGVHVDLIEVAATARAAPAALPGWSPLFQHFAIIVTDMARAKATLDAVAGWSPISVDGPQRLPKNAGGVTAFKFRDPEGHPLELLAFPDAKEDLGASPFVRIDHSAISVVDVDRSIAFYADLGLHVVGRSLNRGIEQQRMDAIDDPQVDVVGLACDADAKPHVELLGYRGAYDRSAGVPHLTDLVATRMMLALPPAASLDTIARRMTNHVIERSATTVLLRDPDGHLLTLVCTT